ncbi:MAG: zinc ribbon domain-containing protein [Litorilinea sp.]
MARKSLGHVELEWQCPTCGNRNPGSSRVCSGCGAPQPDHVEFKNPVSTDLIEDPDKLAQAAAAPDIHCPYCNARNRADATICVQCGGDLTDGAARTEGQVIGALQNDPAAQIACRVCGAENPASAYTCKSCGAPLRATAAEPKPEPEKSKGGCSWVAIAVVLGVIGLIIFGVFYFFTGSAETVDATVVEARWSRTIEVEALMPVAHEAWREDIPQDATLLACRQEVQRTVSDPVPNSREVCGTPYVIDEGTGFGEVVQECEYEVLAEYCEYESLEWGRYDEVQLTGTGHDLRWPVIPLTEDHRAGAQSQTLQCVLSADGRTFTYRTTSESIFASCNPGSQWMLELNRAGGISSIAPQ